MRCSNGTKVPALLVQSTNNDAADRSPSVDAAAGVHRGVRVLLVQKYLLYWYKSTNTGTATAAPARMRAAGVHGGVLCLSLLALLVQQCWLYWYKNPNTGATLVKFTKNHKNHAAGVLCRMLTYADVCVC
jgi:hypothetical protein